MTQTAQIDDGQLGLFGAEELPPPPRPAEPPQIVYIHFEDQAGLDDFGRLVGLKLTTRDKFLRFPIPRFGGQPAPEAVLDVVALLREAREFRPGVEEDGAMIERLVDALEHTWDMLTAANER